MARNIGTTEEERSGVWIRELYGICGRYRTKMCPTNVTRSPREKMKPAPQEGFQSVLFWTDVYGVKIRPE